MLKGKITYNSFTTTKDFDADGGLIKKSESEFSGSADQVITFFPGRYQLMAKNTQKLNEFYEANTYHVFFGEVHDNATSKPILFPVYFSIKSKFWEKCNNEGELILMGTSEANGTSHITAVKTYLSMIPTRSQREVDEDKIIAKGLDAFAKQVMEVKKMQDIKEEKKINEDDYLVPANLYNPGTSGLYLLRIGGQRIFKICP